jgi:hypothetical protein
LYGVIHKLNTQTKSKTEANADIVEYTNKDGLLTTNFSNIIQTKDGYLWILSVKGTYRFDGYEFEEVVEKHPEEIITYLNDEGSRWVYGNEPDDDVTFVVIKVK